MCLGLVYSDIKIHLIEYINDHVIILYGGSSRKPWKGKCSTQRTESLTRFERAIRETIDNFNLDYIISPLYQQRTGKQQ